MATEDNMNDVDLSAPRNEIRTYSVADVMHMLQISRSKAYQLCQGDLFHVVRIGAAIRIPKASFDAWLEHTG